MLAMNFIGFFFVVYLVYNVILLMIDTLLYSSLWQNNTVIDLLRQHRASHAEHTYPSAIKRNSEPLTAIDQAFDAALARIIDSRALRSFDGAFLQCGALSKRLSDWLMTTEKTADSASLRSQDKTAVFQSMVNAFPLFVACTMRRL